VAVGVGSGWQTLLPLDPEHRLEQQSALFLQEAPSGEQMDGVAVGVAVGVGVWADAGAAFTMTKATTNTIQISQLRIRSVSQHRGLFEEQV
jgi:hypothetical protein